ncbi:hypothetical protein [Pseudodesulfovibrio sp. zrk46]|uniref:hypothetical protein n=1 Tax=Pseudodesulfovibrio sp. zrk46 TaxID=2725288 RepID=UPI001448D5CF|nr:hypothetical protein [Pseudodesulfovibrio sp. zrk46]QJB55120.1 hypothetical protein HFN16_01300 [Pseudodesulfovibrio sp. zrk46]
MSEHLTYRKEIRPCVLTFDDIKKIFRELNKCQERAVEIEKKSWKKESFESEQVYKNFVNQRCDNYKISIVVNGANGEDLAGEDSTLFDSDNLPEEVVGVYFSNISWYRSMFGVNPAHCFAINIDFRKPPIIDFSTRSTDPTPNSSIVEVSGNDSLWVQSVVEAVKRVEREKSSNRNILHRPFAYDFVVWFLGIPVGVFGASKCEAFIGKYTDSNFVLYATCIVFFGALLMCFRGAFSYTKWAFPKIELIREGSATLKHRKRWSVLVGTIVLSVISSFVFKAISG